MTLSNAINITPTSASIKESGLGSKNMPETEITAIAVIQTVGRIIAPRLESVRRYEDVVLDYRQDQ